MPTKIEFTSADRKKIHNLYAIDTLVGLILILRCINENSNSKEGQKGS